MGWYTHESNEDNILTEGDSAKTFAIWGRSVTGPEKYGVFPLKGKLLSLVMHLYLNYLIMKN
jgi:DNA topoisomerase-2